MHSSRIPNNLLNYRPHGKRSLGRTLKRWRETETGYLIYGSEAWTIKKADEQRLQAVETKFTRKTAGHTLWDHKRNYEILNNLKVELVFKFIRN
jgi:hypothetical protein